jgi:23S rRNA (adenine-N6)-dimethyltransferase
VSANRRTGRDERRRSLGQNFLQADLAADLVEAIDVAPGELIVEPGAGNGAIALALARRGADVIAVELDPAWVRRLRDRSRASSPGRIRVIHGDFLSVRLPSRPYRVIGCPPFGQSTALLRRLLEHEGGRLERVDLILQWEVARKRAAHPPTTLLSTVWAPWWEFLLGDRIPASRFRPVPRVDGGLLTARRRDPPLLPLAMAAPYADFVSARWPFRTLRTAAYDHPTSATGSRGAPLRRG